MSSPRTPEAWGKLSGGYRDGATAVHLGRAGSPATVTFRAKTSKRPRGCGPPLPHRGWPGRGQGQRFGAGSHSDSTDAHPAPSGFRTPGTAILLCADSSPNSAGSEGLRETWAPRSRGTGRAARCRDRRRARGRARCASSTPLLVRFCPSTCPAGRAPPRRPPRATRVSRLGPQDAVKVAVGRLLVFDEASTCVACAVYVDPVVRSPTPVVIDQLVGGLSTVYVLTGVPVAVLPA
jgi:hypothetical protein